MNIYLQAEHLHRIESVDMCALFRAIFYSSNIFLIKAIKMHVWTDMCCNCNDILVRTSYSFIIGYFLNVRQKKITHDQSIFIWGGISNYIHQRCKLISVHFKNKKGHQLSGAFQ